MRCGNVLKSGMRKQADIKCRACATGKSKTQNERRKIIYIKKIMSFNCCFMNSDPNQKCATLKNEFEIVTRKVKMSDIWFNRITFAFSLSL